MSKPSTTTPASVSSDGPPSASGDRKPKKSGKRPKKSRRTVADIAAAPEKPQQS